MSIKPGALRFNTDSMKLEIFRGSANYEGSASMAGIGTLAAGQWEEIVATSPEAQTGGTRGVFGGGTVTLQPKVDTIDYINISSTGNAIDFGNLTSVRGDSPAPASSKTRGVFGGGNPNPASGQKTTQIDYITIASTGDAATFGQLAVATRLMMGCSSSTRGVFAGGEASGNVNTISYITIAQTGNAVDFGDLSSTVSGPGAGCGSATRGLFGGGNDGSTINTISFITISTLGNAADFGDLTRTAYVISAASNSYRAIWAAGYPGSGPAYVNTMDYVTIATLGNAQDFGDMGQSNSAISGVASPTRAVYGGGYAPATKNTIEHVTIANLGNAVDFGDLTQGRSYLGGVSNGHGGL